ncbi:hypothetical protein LSH36_271g06021 [Paralvinella palmiformis]|uniref:Nucleotide-diphospho-sugar transferase domain-containing protein n=1 Tax=Paralvinella palmiformis TaxID=53620 RepID=A0AAD9JJQ8_9ANNE|nr:hypothetical protein LSH36_271g06021 [Paralvinella palmiformis]
MKSWLGVSMLGLSCAVIVIIIAEIQLTDLQKAVGYLRRQRIAKSGYEITLQDVMRSRALDNTIVLSSVDSGYLDMAVNLYLTSLKRFNVENYLFVGSDPDICNKLANFSIACFDYIHDPDGSTASGYFSEAFKRKTHLKTKIILEALMLGLKVLITDVDIVFFTNPLPLFTCTRCDIEISSDVIEGNSGFYFARPTAASIKLHETAWKQGLAQPHISNQKAIDRNMEKMQLSRTITVKTLDPKTYINGKVYFEDGERMFKGDNLCEHCVMVHNNWIVTGAAKVYRFKECGLWENDKNQYYSDRQQRYLSFDLPRDYGSVNTIKFEEKALRNAFILGAILGRTVILPKFHCYGCKFSRACKKPNAKCTLGTFYKIERFDSQLKDKYRESVFLSHDKVPDSVKSSLSPVFLINSSQDIGTLTKNIVKLSPKDPGGATDEEIVDWFGNRKESVLRFHSLYNSIKYNETNEKVANILKKLKSGLARSDYRQYQ